MAKGVFTSVVDELQESNMIENEALSVTLDIKPILEEGFLFLGEMVEELKLSLSNSIQPMTALVEEASSDSTDAVIDSNDDVVAAEEETQEILKTGLALLGDRLGGILGIFKRRERDEAGDDLQEGEDAREAAKARLKDAAKRGGTKVLDFAKSTGIGSSIAGIIGTLRDTWAGIAAAGAFFSTTIIPLLTGGGGFAGFLGTMKALVSKVFLPLTMIIGSIQGVLTFMKNKDTLGAFEAFKLGFTDFVSAVVGWPIDIILWLSEKVAGMFGLDFLESMFAEMNFKDGFMTLLNWLGTAGEWLGDIGFKIYEAISSPIDTLKSMLSGAADGIGNMLNVSDFSDKINDVMKALLKSILPRPKSGKKWYTSIAGLTAKAIPESIYKYAGINKKTGEDIESPITVRSKTPAEQAIPQIGKNKSTQQSQLAQAYINDTAQRQSAAGSQATVVPISNVSDNSTKNSNMTVVNNNGFPQQSVVHDF